MVVAIPENTLLLETGPTGNRNDSRIVGSDILPKVKKLGTRGPESGQMVEGQGALTIFKIQNSN